MINYTTILSYIGKTLYILLKVLFWIIIGIIGIITAFVVASYAYSRLIEQDRQSRRYSRYSNQL